MDSANIKNEDPVYMVVLRHALKERRQSLHKRMKMKRRSLRKSMNAKPVHHNSSTSNFTTGGGSVVHGNAAKSKEKEPYFSDDSAGEQKGIRVGDQVNTLLQVVVHLVSLVCLELKALNHQDKQYL